MLLKSLTGLFFILLITACGSNTAKVLDTGKTALDIYIAAEPIRNKIATSLVPTPTFSSRPPIQAYFTLASSPNCEIFNDNDVSTFRSIACREVDTAVRFDEWFLEGTENDILNYLLESPDNQVITEAEWYDATNPEVNLGRFLQYSNKDGEALVFWTVYGKGLSGWAIRADGDQKALYQWWINSGSPHN